MAKFLAQIQSVQQRASALAKRLDTVQENAVSTKWPHSGLRTSVREYVKATVPSVRAAINAAGSAMQIQPRLIHNPATLLNDQRLQRYFRTYSTRNSLDENEVSKAAFAYAEVHLKVATHMVQHLENCIEGTETIEGRAVARGPLWDK